MTDWRDIPGFPGYQVSREGQVRNRAGRLLKMKRDAHGYHRQTAIGDDGRYHLLSAHVAVLEAFVGPRPEGHDASHLSGDQSDNRLQNLAWETSSENHQRKFAHGTLIHGEKHKCAKLSAEQVRAIRGRRGERVRDVGAEYGVSGTLVSRIQRGLAWPHVA